jgi:hypothetical protein
MSGSPRAATALGLIALFVFLGESQAVAQTPPIISSVSFSGSQDGSMQPTVTIAGSGFRPQPVATPAVCGGFLFPGTQLHFGVEAAGGDGFNAGAASNLLGLVVASYTDTSISYQFGSGGCGYPTFGKVAQGETFTVDVNGATCKGIVDYTKPIQCAAPPKDTTPPVLSLPGDLILDATSMAGAVAVYAPTAKDDDGLAYPVSCTPASGSTFPIGTSTVSCQATDAAGNTALGGFHVQVRDALQQLGDLVAIVQRLGPGRSLAGKLQSAAALLRAGDAGTACNILGAFVSEVQAQTGKSLPALQAQTLVADAIRIKAVIGCA